MPPSQPQLISALKERFYLMSNYTREDCDHLYKLIEKSKCELSYELVHRYANKLNKLAVKTKTCSECFQELTEDKSNKETKDTGICSDCFKLWQHDDDIAFRNNVDCFSPCHMDGTEYWHWQMYERHSHHYRDIREEEDE